MSHGLIAVLKIGGMFAVMLVGWEARRRGRFSAETASDLSQFLVDVALPALILDQMITALDGAALKRGYSMPLVAAVVALVCLGVGVGLGGLFAPRRQRPTFAFLVAVPNWVYLPLPIAEALFGAEGKLAVLLYNVGALVMVWTVGIAALRGAWPDRAALRGLASNPGLIATVGGAAAAILVPSLRGADSFAPGSPPWRLAAGALLQAVAMVGSLTVPLSMLITGAQLGALKGRGGALAPVAGVLLARLVASPLAVIALAVLAQRLGFRPSGPARLTAYLIASMPVAVNCALFAERFGGDVGLAARSIFYSTLASAATAPAFLYLAERFDW
jgi:predicted permease